MVAMYVMAFLQFPFHNFSSYPQLSLVYCLTWMKFTGVSGECSKLIRLACADRLPSSNTVRSEPVRHHSAVQVGSPHTTSSRSNLDPTGTGSRAGRMLFEVCVAPQESQVKQVFMSRRPRTSLFILQPHVSKYATHFHLIY